MYFVEFNPSVEFVCGDWVNQSPQLIHNWEISFCDDTKSFLGKG